MTVQGEKRYVRLVRVKTNRRERDRGYWITNDYALTDHAAVPARLRGASLSIRFDSTEDDDRQRGWSLTENLRIIDEMDADFQSLYGIRNNAENVNRRLEDTLWAGRAHSVGIARQRIDHLGYALYNNLIARIAYEERTGVAAAPWLTRPRTLAIAV